MQTYTPNTRTHQVIEKIETFFNIQEAAQASGLSHAFIKRVFAGHPGYPPPPPHRRIQRNVLIPASKLSIWINSLTDQPQDLVVDQTKAKTRRGRGRPRKNTNITTIN